MLKRIDHKFVHKVCERNVLIADVRPKPGEEGWFEAELVPDLDHPFFFEHPLDHFPAMMLVEAGRQLGIAISHMYLGVPLGTMFATRSLDIEFTEFAETMTPVIISISVTDKQYRRGELIHLRMDGYFSQNSKRLGRMGGNCSMLSLKLWRRYRRLEKWKNRCE